MSEEQRRAFERALVEVCGDNCDGMKLDDQDAMRIFEWACNWKDEQAAGAEPVAHVFPDDLDRLETTECAVNAYSVEMGDPDRGETVALYKAATQQPKAVPDGLLEEWAADFEEAIKFAPTRLEKVILKTRAEQCRSFARKYNPSPLVEPSDDQEAPDE